MKSKICVCAFALLFLLVPVSPAQDKLRTIEHTTYRHYDIKTEPIAIVSRQVGDKPFANETQIESDNGWLRNLTFGVKNISDKTIKDFEIQLIIPKQGDMIYPAALSAWYSSRNPLQKPEGKQTDQSNGKEGLAPGDVVKVKVTVGRMLDDLKLKGVEDIGTVYMLFGRVLFDDGTAWYSGIPMLQDPNTPGRLYPAKQ